MCPSQPITSHNPVPEVQWLVENIIIVSEQTVYRNKLNWKCHYFLHFLSTYDFMSTKKKISLNICLVMTKAYLNLLHH